VVPLVFPSAKYHLTVREAARHVMRQVALEVGARDFALAAGHRLNVISLLAGTLNSAAAFAVAAASSSASTAAHRQKTAATQDFCANVR
jgi:ribosomal protein L18